MADSRSRDRSSSAESQLKFPGCTHFRRRNDNHFRCQQCRLNEGLTLCTEDSPCDICKDWLPEAWQAQAKANEQKKQRKVAKKSQERETMDDSVEIHAPEEVLQLPSKRARSDASSKSKRAKTATSSGSKATEVEKSAVRPSRSREPKKSVASSVSVAGWASSDGSKRHRSRSGDHKRRSHGCDRRQDSPRHHTSRHDSGRREGERSRPSSSGGSSSRRHVDSTGGSGSSCVSKATDARPSASSSHAHHHRKSSGDRRSLSSSSSRASADRKSPPGHHHERRRECAERSGSSYVSRQEVQLSPAVTQSPERRTITVIPSLARPDHVEEPAAEVAGPAIVTGPSEVVDGPADDGPASDSPAGNDPADDGPAYDGSAGDGSAGDGSARHDEPVVLDGPDEVADPARQQSATDGSALQFDDPAALDGPACHQPLVLDGPAAHGTPAGNTPSGGQDASILTGVSSPLFPSVPTSINQATLIDFMSMWTLLQQRMDQGMAVPDGQARPVAQSTVPLPRDDTPPRRSDTPSRTPERRPRTSDGPGLLWEEPGGWTTRGSLFGHVLQLQGLHQSIHLPEMPLLWISLRLWILRTRSRRDPFPTKKMKTAITRRSQQHSISCSDKLLRLPRDRSKSTLPRHAGVQDVVTGSGRQWGYRSGILVGPAFSQRHDGFYCPYRSRVKRRWRGREDYVIWDFEYSFFDVQAPHGEADIPERTIPLSGSYCGKGIPDNTIVLQSACQGQQTRP